MDYEQKTENSEAQRKEKQVSGVQKKYRSVFLQFHKKNITFAKQ